MTKEPDDPKVVSIFEKFAGRKSEKIEKTKDGKRIYSAAGYHPQFQRVPRLTIFYPDNRTIESISYAHILNVITRESTEMLIICTNCVIECRGDNFAELVDFFGDEDIRFIHCYDKEVYDELSGENHPIIHDIIRHERNEFFL